VAGESDHAELASNCGRELRAHAARCETSSPSTARATYSASVSFLGRHDDQHQPIAHSHLIELGAADLVINWPT